MLGDNKLLIKTKTGKVIGYDLNKKSSTILPNIDPRGTVKNIPGSSDFWLQSPSPQNSTFSLFTYYKKQVDGSYEKEVSHQVKITENIWAGKDSKLLFWNKDEQHTYTVFDANTKPQTFPFSNQINAASFPSISYDKELDRFFNATRWTV